MTNARYAFTCFLTDSSYRLCLNYITDIFIKSDVSSILVIVVVARVHSFDVICIQCIFQSGQPQPHMIITISSLYWSLLELIDEILVKIMVHMEQRGASTKQITTNTRIIIISNNILRLPSASVWRTWKIIALISCKWTMFSVTLHLLWCEFIFLHGMVLCTLLTHAATLNTLETWVIKVFRISGLFCKNKTYRILYCHT